MTARNLDTYRPKVPAKVVDVYADRRHLGQRTVIECPFCGAEHWHGESLGGRNSHCLPHNGWQRGELRPNDAYGNPGYDLCDPADPVDWDVERAMAQLWVTRNRYRRLRAEYDEMDPWTAKEKRVKRTLGEQCGQLATLLRGAGVSL